MRWTDECDKRQNDVLKHYSTMSSNETLCMDALLDWASKKYPPPALAAPHLFTSVYSIVQLQWTISPKKKTLHVLLYKHRFHEHQKYPGK